MANSTDVPRIYSCKRCGYRALFDTEEEMLVHLRTEHRDIDDGRYDYSVNMGM